MKTTAIVASAVGVLFVGSVLFVRHEEAMRDRMAELQKKADTLDEFCDDVRKTACIASRENRSAAFYVDRSYELLVCKLTSPGLDQAVRDGNEPKTRIELAKLMACDEKR